MIDKVLAHPDEPPPTRPDNKQLKSPDALSLSPLEENPFDGTPSSNGHAYGSEEEYWASFRSWDLQCLVFDLDSLRIICATDKICAMLGFAHGELEKSDLAVLWPPSEFASRREFVERTKGLASGDSGELVPLRRADGSQLMSRFTWRNVERGAMNLRVVFFPDLQAVDVKV